MLASLPPALSREPSEALPGSNAPDSRTLCVLFSMSPGTVLVFRFVPAICFQYCWWYPAVGLHVCLLRTNCHHNQHPFHVRQGEHRVPCRFQVTAFAAPRGMEPVLAVEKSAHAAAV